MNPNAIVERGFLLQTTIPNLPDAGLACPKQSRPPDIANTTPRSGSTVENHASALLPKRGQMHVC